MRRYHSGKGLTVDDIIAILPAPTSESAPFWEGCNRGELLLQRCEACRHVFYYPRLFCPRCGDRKLVWQAASGRGVVYSFTHVEVSFYGPKWESQLPYTPVLVDLEEGVRMLSRLVGADRANVKIGNRVALSFVAFEKQQLPFFTLVPLYPC